MKTILIIIILSIPTLAFSETYWTCQCFETELSSIPLEGVTILNKDSLQSAEESALKLCKKNRAETIEVARCLKYVVNDH